MNELDVNQQCFCIKCGQQLAESEIDGYSFQCTECDEDFFSFEVQEAQIF